MLGSDDDTGDAAPDAAGDAASDGADDAVDPLQVPAQPSDNDEDNNPAGDSPKEGGGRLDSCIDGQQPASLIEGVLTITYYAKFQIGT